MGVFLVLVKVCSRPGCEKSPFKKGSLIVTFAEILRQKTKKREKNHHRDHRINHQATQPPPIHYGLLLHLMLVSFFFQKSSRQISTTIDDVPGTKSSSSCNQVIPRSWSATRSTIGYMHWNTSNSCPEVLSPGERVEKGVG